MFGAMMVMVAVLLRVHLFERWNSHRELIPLVDGI